jgi:iron complex transport system substrate-binding protein
MVGGLWTPELVNLAGGEPLVTKAGDRTTQLTKEELRALDPDVVFLKPCGFDLTRAMEEADLIRECIPARASVFVANGNAFFNRSGPRIVDSLEILAACTHPERLGDLGKKHQAEFAQLRW